MSSLEQQQERWWLSKPNKAIVRALKRRKKCKHVFEQLWTYEENEVKVNYCPICGVKRPE